MWPFKKKPLPPDRLPLPESWAVSTGEYAGKVMLLRVHEGYRQYGGVAGYDHQVGIAIPLRSPTEQGLPTPEENIEIQAIEDTVEAALEAGGASLQVAVITTSGMKELVFYTTSPEAVKHRFEELRGQTSSHELQLMIQRDAGWKVYGRLK